MSFSEKQKALLARASAENAQAGFPFAPTEYWERETTHLRTEFQEKGIESFLESQYNTRFHGIQKNDPRLYGWFLHVFYNFLRMRDSLGLLDRLDCGVSESTVVARSEAWRKTDKGTPIRVQGKLVYADFLFSLYDFYNLYELCPAVATEAIVVGDVGAGYGRIGHVLVQANPKATYLVFDIPGPLVISSATLPELLPNSRIKTYEESRGDDEITRDKISQSTIWILGSHDLRRLQRGAVDILVNVASFQEMPANQVNAYLQVFDQAIQRGWIYLRNNSFSKFGLSAPNDYRLPIRWRSRFTRPTAFSEAIFEAGFAVD